MPDIPVQDSGAAPETVDDPLAMAESIVADPTRQGSPEWLAAQTLLAEHGRTERAGQNFGDLEKEMQALRGMSEI